MRTTTMQCDAQIDNKTTFALFDNVEHSIKRQSLCCCVLASAFPSVTDKFILLLLKQQLEMNQCNINACRRVMHIVECTCFLVRFVVCVMMTPQLKLITSDDRSVLVESHSCHHNNMIQAMWGKFVFVPTLLLHECFSVCFFT